MVAIVAAVPAAAPAIPAPYDRTTVSVGRRTLPAIVVHAPLSRYRLGVTLAGPRVGDNAWLASIAQASGAA